MKAITLWQPWASLISIGAKTIETRSWATKYRGPLLIHAAKRWDEEIAFQRQLAVDKLTLMLFRAPSERHEAASRWPTFIVRGAVLALAHLVDCRLMETAPDPVNAEFGDFGPGRYGWVLDSVMPLDQPVPWSGAQGLWDVPDDLLSRCEIGRLPALDSAVLDANPVGPGRGLEGTKDEEKP